MILMLGGLRELIATTVEDGGDIGGITDVAVRATQAMLGPPAPRPVDEGRSALGSATAVADRG
jgi:hypothetical protein